MALRTLLILALLDLTISGIAIFWMIQGAVDSSPQRLIHGLALGAVGVVLSGLGATMSARLGAKKDS